MPQGAATRLAGWGQMPPWTVEDVDIDERCEHEHDWAARRAPARMKIMKYSFVHQ
jgi:hypothetical protein